jgi:hypothetical protein
MKRENHFPPDKENEGERGERECVRERERQREGKRERYRERDRERQRETERDTIWYNVKKMLKSNL